MRVAILEAFDVAKGLRFVKAVFKLHQANSDCRKFIGGRDLSCGPHCNAASGRASGREEESEQLLSTHCDVS
jgi:hypothetical protein